jgi:lysozyme family protein
MKEFFWALAIILQIEGGLTEIDGGTMYGITAATLTRANKLRVVQRQDIRSLSRREAAKIYYEMFWLESGAHKYKRPLNLVVFDAAVHSGPGKSKELLYTSLRKTPNQLRTPKIIANQMLIERHRHLMTLGNYTKYQRGWLRRLRIIMSHVIRTRKEKALVFNDMGTWSRQIRDGIRSNGIC